MKTRYDRRLAPLGWRNAGVPPSEGWRAPARTHRALALTRRAPRSPVECGADHGSGLLLHLREMLRPP